MTTSQTDLMGKLSEIMNKISSEVDKEILLLKGLNSIRMSKRLHDLILEYINVSESKSENIDDLLKLMKELMVENQTLQIMLEKKDKTIH